MSMRTFPEVKIPHGSDVTMAMRITCASCDGVAYFPFQTGFSRKPPIAAEQHFRNKNWSVGNHPRKDFCPECTKRGKSRKAIPMKEQAVASAAEPPRQITRDDRRIINDKLDEVYGNGGYKTPWTDSAVAKDLGVPRDWVSKTREDFFGAAGSNPLFDDFLIEKDKVADQIRGLAARYDAALKAFEDYRADFAKVSEALKSVQLLAKRIEREIAR